MLGRWLVAAGFSVAIAMGGAAPASANHSTPGSGGCDAHTRACYPNCWYEWTGAPLNAADPPADNGPCDMPALIRPDGSLVVDWAGSTELPVRIVNTDEEPVPVATSTAWPVAWDSSNPVTVTNGAGSRIPVDTETELTLAADQEMPARIVNEGFDAKTLYVAYALGGLVAAFIVGPVLFRSLVRNKGPR